MKYDLLPTTSHEVVIAKYYLGAPSSDGEFILMRSDGVSMASGLRKLLSGRV